jgi:hypothetical protein
LRPYAISNSVRVTLLANVNSSVAQNAKSLQRCKTH